MERKYELTKETKTYFGQTVYRIKSLRTFIDAKGNVVNAGDLGGWVRSEINLSHEGNCWIRDNAIATTYAIVDGNALLEKESQAYGTANISDESIVTDFAQIGGQAKVFGNCRIRGKSKISGSAEVFGSSFIDGEAFISDQAVVFGDSIIIGPIVIYDSAKIKSTEIRGLARIEGNAKLYGVSLRKSNINLSFNAYITSEDDLLVVGPIGSRNDYTTFYKTKNKGIWVCCGCFNDSIEAFAKKVYSTHGNSHHTREYLAAVELAKMKLDRGE